MPDLPRRAAVRLGRILAFVRYFLVNLLIANVIVAREILRVRSCLRPAIAHMPLRATTSTEIALLVLCVGLTPGTLTVDIRRSPPSLFVHGMHAGDARQFRRRLAELEEKLLLAVRPVTSVNRVPEPPDYEGDIDRKKG